MEIAAGQVLAFSGGNRPILPKAHGPIPPSRQVRWADKEFINLRVECGIHCRWAMYRITGDCDAAHYCPLPLLQESVLPDLRTAPTTGFPAAELCQEELAGQFAPGLAGQLIG